MRTANYNGDLFSYISVDSMTLIIHMTIRSTVRMIYSRKLSCTIFRKEIKMQFNLYTYVHIYIRQYFAKIDQPERAHKYIKQ